MVASWVVGLGAKAVVGPRAAFFTLCALSLMGGASIFALLYVKRKAANSMQTLKTVMGLTAAIVLVAFLIFSYYLGGRLGPDMDDGASDSGSAAAAAAATAKLPVKVPGEMAQPVLGLGIFTVALVMIGTMDSYFGIPMLVLRFFSGGRAPITWADAYEPLHADIGVGPAASLPTSESEGGRDGKLDGASSKDGEAFPLSDAVNANATQAEVDAEQKKPLL